ncbi:MAG TPA: S8 family serine peptidase [Stackebrandtia sp.]|uniref:S8 family peptidase n=1 Tax=Stackebrandtia sp. TaxID=2023065 RepID=UPI002D5B01EF|nr:S8 family serine peptidase [Stackebrandtia sp.]HZE39023.1 S8 family serine peptidase [Stackebrandtia sp.]
MRTVRLVAALVLAAGFTLALPTTAHADQTRDSQWYLNSLHVTDAQKFAQGKGVTIGFIGGTVDATHPDLADAVASTHDFGASEQDNAEQSGTGPASVLAGRGHGGDKGVLGVAPKAQLALAFVDTGQEDLGRRGVEIAQAMQYLLDQHVDLIVVTVPAPSDNTGNVQKLTDQAYNDDVPVISASGDHASGVSPNEAYFPASSRHAIPAVGATKDGKFWPRSVPPTPDGADERSQPLTLAAPAAGIVSARANGKYGTADGTAFAAALTAGTFALVKSRWPDVTWDEIVGHVIGAASNGNKYDDKLGHGVVDPCKALGSAFGSHKTVGREGKCVPTADGDAAVGGPSAHRDNTVLASAIGLIGVAGLAALVLAVRVRDRRGSSRTATNQARP